MKKVFWIKPIIFAAILLLSACKKELPSGNLEWKPTHYPVVKTLYVTNLTSTTVTLNGTVNGYGLPTTVTFEYGSDTSASKGENPISYSNTVIASQSPVADTGLINISADISGLNPCQVYHFRLKAENSLWKNFYGEQQSFSTIHDPGSPSVPPPIPFNPDLTYGTISDIDGNNYKTIQIGYQVWMAENLRTTRYADGTAIPLITNRDEWAALTVTDKACCRYNYWSCDCDTTSFGAYYTWAAAMNGASSSASNPSGVQGVCPDGWHLPSNDEWRILAYFLGGMQVAGGKLKDTITWYPEDPIGTNESGFTALAGGTCEYSGDFRSSGIYSFMWSSTDSDTEFGHAGGACQGWLREEFNSFSIVTDLPDEGNSVRCLKDYAQQGQAPIVTTQLATNITSTGATFNGTVNANGSPTIVEFEYYAPRWLSQPGVWVGELRKVLATQSPITGTSPTQVSVDVTGLRSGTTRKFRVIATNSVGVFYGDYVSYTLP